MLPEFLKFNRRQYEVIVVRRVEWFGREYDARACHTLRRFYVTSALCLADQRAALAQVIREARRLRSPHWQPV